MAFFLFFIIGNLWELLTFLCCVHMWTLLLAVFSVAFVVYSIRFYLYRQKRGWPGPPEYPLILNTIEVIRGYDQFYQFWVDCALKYGPTFSLCLPLFPESLIVGDPAVVTHMLQTNFENYPKGDRVAYLLHDLLGGGIFTSDGKAWEVQRKIASHLFSVSKLKYMSRVFLSHGERLIAHLHSLEGQVVDAQQLFLGFTFESFAEIGFGEQIDCITKQHPFAAAFTTASKNTDQRFTIPKAKLLGRLLPTERALYKALKEVDEFAYGVIARRRATEKIVADPREDLISMFLHFTDDEGNAAIKTDKDLRDLIMNFIIAGRDTTATTLTFLFYSLAHNPEVRKKVLAEMKEKVGGKEPDFEAMKNLPYLQACINETLRLYPPVPGDPKLCLKDDILPNGMRVPAGAYLTWSAFVMGRMPQYWDAPLEFRPMRWLSADANGGKPMPSGNTPPFAPFQYGPRTCLGMQMAYLEVKAVTVMILQRFHLEHVGEVPVKFDRAITLAARGGMPMRVHKQE